MWGVSVGGWVGGSLSVLYVCMPCIHVRMLMFSSSKIQGVIGGRGVWGGTCSHHKAFWLSPFPT